MRAIIRGSCVVVVLLGALVAIGADSLAEKTAKTESNLMTARDRVLQSLDELEASLKTYGIAAPDIADARTTLDEMLKSVAWRNLSSRTTKNREAAEETLGQYLTKARAQAEGSRKKLARIKKAEYEEWARTHPAEAAKLLEMERRVAAAEEEAESAQSNAAAAQFAAEDARFKAEEASRRAGAAQDRAERAEDRLFHQGIYSH